MPPLALALALTAAVVHAGWNLLLARAEDSQAATAVAGVVGAVAFLPVALLVWDVDTAVVPYAAASACLELLYLALLGYAYSRAHLSVVYPIARGGAPVLVLVVGAVLVGLTPTLGEAAGVGLVAAGVLLVRGLRRVDGTAPGRDVAIALSIAACIAGYTLIDREGVRHASPVAYLWLVLAAPSVVYAGILARARPDAVRRAFAPPTIAAGIGMYAGFGLVLTALTMAPPASVSAVRESSVVIAAFLGAAVLREPVGASRLAGAVLVAGGVVLLALG